MSSQIPPQIICNYCKTPVLKKEELFVVFCLPKIVCFRHLKCIPSYSHRFFQKKGDIPYINISHWRGFPPLTSKHYVLHTSIISIGSILFFTLITGSVRANVFLIPFLIFFFVFPRIYFYYKFERYFDRQGHFSNVADIDNSKRYSKEG